MALISLQNLLNEIVRRKEIPSHVREGMVRGACEAHIAYGSDEEKVKESVKNVVKYNIDECRREAVIAEDEVDMLLRIKECI